MNIVFDPKPESVPYNYRISYKVSQICMILEKASKGSGTSLTKLQMISMAINIKSEENKLLEFLEKKGNHIIIRNDPAVNQAISYAFYDELIYQQKNKLFRATKKGKKLVELIYLEEKLMNREKVVLERISYRLTENIIDEQLRLWGRTNVNNK